MPRYTKTERLGVNAVESIVLKDLDSIFREQLVMDMGIDAQIELSEGGSPSGKLIGVQIKTGASHFNETDDHFIYYGDLTHLDYWLGHSLPVILVGHLPGARLTIWSQVRSDNITRTKKGWKIEIPKGKILDSSSLPELRSIAEGPPSQQRFRRLSLDEPLMRHIQEGGKVSLELEDWVNKSLGRTPVKVYIHDPNGNEILEREWFQYYVGYKPKDLAEALFPWSTASVDEEFYDDNEEGYNSDQWSSISEDDEEVSNTLDFIRPYCEAAGEVEYYRLRLDINELGQAFLRISDYINANN